MSAAEAQMEVSVIGSGGREHVLADVLGASDNVSAVHALPGNPGIDMLPKGVSVPNVGVMDFDNIVRYHQEKGIKLAVVGPESPLIGGLADVLRANGILTVGPSRKASQFEGSKIFTNDFNSRHDIPQPKGMVARNPRSMISRLKQLDANGWVIKADGEAGGKGVGVPDSFEEALEFVNRMVNGDLKKAAATGALWQRRFPLSDPEVSDYWAIDKSGNKLNLGAAQDHKRVGEGDTGKNGGGSGAYSDVPYELYSESHREQSEYDTQRFIEGAIEDGVDYQGFLFRGLMIHNDIPNVLEYNIRFGDPEAQVILPRWQRAGVDFHELFMAMAEGKLDQITLPKLTGSAALTICLMAEGYPGSSPKGDEILGLDKHYDDNVMIYHGGTRRGDDGKLYTNGGRILYVTAFGEDLVDAQGRALWAIGEENNGVHFRGMHFRPDIGARALNAA